MSASHQRISIRPAREAEARACRILLPEMFTADQSPELLVAIYTEADRPDAHRFAGALGLTTVHGPRVPGFSFLLNVLPEFRRQGIGRAMAEAAIARSIGRTPVLRALRPVAAGSAAALFLHACGFADHDEIRYFEADCAPLHAQMLALRTRLERRGAVPANARVVPLREAPAGGVATLVAAEFPTSREQFLGRLAPGAPGGYDLDHSVALLVGEELGGVLFGTRSGGIPMIDGRIVAPGYRGGWANILLLERITRAGMELGASRFRFFADSRVADTMSLARRSRADEIRVELHCWRRLA